MALTEVSITTTTTITSSGYGKLHVCGGTSANYAVTLPDATVAPTGTLIGFRMETSKIISLTAASGQDIDGLSPRVMWNAESCILESNGSGWRKIAGNSIPMNCTMRLSTAQSGVVSTTETTVLLDQTDVDNTNLMADTSAHCINILRGSNYNLRGLVMANLPAGNIVRFIGSIFRDNGGGYAILLQHEMGLLAGSYSGPLPGALGYGLGKGDKLRLSCLQTSGSTQSIYGASSGTCSLLSVNESPAW